MPGQTRNSRTSLTGMAKLTLAPGIPLLTIPISFPVLIDHRSAGVTGVNRGVELDGRQLARFSPKRRTVPRVDADGRIAVVRGKQPPKGIAERRQRHGFDEIVIRSQRKGHEVRRRIDFQKRQVIFFIELDHPCIQHILGVLARVYDQTHFVTEPRFGDDVLIGDEEAVGRNTRG